MPNNTAAIVICSVNLIGSRSFRYQVILFNLGNVCSVYNPRLMNLASFLVHLINIPRLMGLASFLVCLVTIQDLLDYLAPLTKTGVNHKCTPAHCRCTPVGAFVVY